MTHDPSSRHFIRRPEDFTCANCGVKVHGTGYTDHCPSCLWSKHLDVNPGDRAAACDGMMKPVSAVCDHNGTFTITYLCMRCGMRRRFKQAENDSREELERLLNAGP